MASENKVHFENKHIDHLIKFVNENNNRHTFTFFNQHDLYQHTKESAFKETIEKEHNLNFIDGMTIQRYLAARKFKKVHRMRGPFFTKSFLKHNSAANFKHFFIGFEDKDITLLQEKHAHLTQVKGYNPPYVKGLHFGDEEIEKIADMINEFNADIVWVGIGCPKQNILSSKLFPKTKSQYFMNVGAALDFVLEKKSEAPGLIQTLGIEWFYRLITDFKHSRKKVLRSFISLNYLKHAELRE